jgi:hypothetical protein
LCRGAFLNRPCAEACPRGDPDGFDEYDARLGPSLSA